METLLSRLLLNVNLLRIQVLHGISIILICNTFYLIITNRTYPEEFLQEEQEEKCYGGFINTLKIQRSERCKDILNTVVMTCSNDEWPNGGRNLYLSRLVYI